MAIQGFHLGLKFHFESFPLFNPCQYCIYFEVIQDIPWLKLLSFNKRLKSSESNYLDSIYQLSKWIVTHLHVALQQGSNCPRLNLTAWAEGGDMIPLRLLGVLKGILELRS